MTACANRITAPIPALALLSALATCGCAATDTTDTILDRSTVSLVRDGKVVGALERFVREIETGRQVVTRQTMKVTVSGTNPRTLVQEVTQTEDHDRNTVAVRYVSRIGGYETVTTAEVSDTQALVRRESPSDTRKTIIKLPDGLRFDNGAGLLEQWDPDQTPRLEFFELDVRAPLIERVAYVMAESQEPGARRTLLRLSYAFGQLRSFSRLHLDDTGAFLSSDQAMLGSAIQIDTSAAGNVGSTNPVRESFHKSPYRISRDAMDGHIRYTFGLVPGADFLPPATGEQRVTALPGGFVLDICETCGPGLDTSDESLAAALEPTFWLQSDHPRLARIANRFRGRGATDSQVMVRLAGWARKRMEDIDFAGHYSAADALARRSGDCTEGAVVLAALGRAAGIPTRVASGIVYSRERYHGVSHAFMPHAWTLAFVDGEWKSFDMSLEAFDATHIALTISDGDPGSIQAGHQLAALLRWDAMTEVRKRP